MPIRLDLFPRTEAFQCSQGHQARQHFRCLRSQHNIHVGLADSGLAMGREEPISYIGSNIYMAPKVYQNGHGELRLYPDDRWDYGMLVDIWPLGVTTYEQFLDFPNWKGD